MIIHQLSVLKRSRLEDGGANPNQWNLDEPLRIGIGVHSGTAIVGRMGYKQASSLTAIGDVVNTASRLESLTKELGAQTVISEKTVRNGGITLEGAEKQEVTVRGRKQPLMVYTIKA